MDEAFIGSIVLFAGNFAPRNWAFCNGQILNIAQNTALFSILGTTYGGNGQTTFALPNLNGRVAIGAGNGPGLTPRSLGEMSGSEGVTLTAAQVPSGLTPVTVDLPQTSDTQQVAKVAAGGNQPHSNMQPYTAMNYIICLYGIYPSRG